MTIFWQGSPNEGIEYRGYEKITIFGQYTRHLLAKQVLQNEAKVYKDNRFISEMIQYRTIVVMEYE